MGRSTVREIIAETCEVLWKTLSPVYVEQPNDIVSLKILAIDFNDKWNLPNCIGAIDGKHINIEAPPTSASNYFNFKIFFSIVLLAVCDANNTFTNICVGDFGSQSDGGTNYIYSLKIFI